jgi:hypothetical protein
MSACITRCRRRPQRPPARPRRAQQLKVDRLREECNRQRPHAALDRHTSASRDAPSPREMPHRRPPLEYPDRFEVRDVSANGGIRWNRQGVQVSIPGAGAEVGLDKIDTGVWNVYCSPLKRDRLLERHLRIEDAYGRLQQHRQPMSPDFFVTYLPGWSHMLLLASPPKETALTCWGCTGVALRRLAK